MSTKRASRRNFLKTSAAMAAGALFFDRRLAAQETPAKKEGAGKKILILGGTGFLGPAVVEAAKARGHVLTLFNRGKTNPHLFPELEKIQGDRNKDLEKLKGRTWDAVVDTSAYYPRQVDASAGLLKEAVKQYVFISSISVYPDIETKDTDEKSTVSTLTAEEAAAAKRVTEGNYGALKALSEAAAEKHLPGRTTNIRPGLIVGPGDETDRFSYWPLRVRDGGEVLCPGAPDHAVQYIDVRDLGRWIVHCIETGIVGVFNALGPSKPMPMGDLLKTCKDVAKSDATLVWADAEFLAAEKVTPWGDMPLWIPPTKELGRCAICSCEKAVKAGLVFRPLSDTVKDLLTWFDAERKDDKKIRAGISREREKEVLAAWKAKKAVK